MRYTLSHINEYLSKNRTYLWYGSPIQNLNLLTLPYKIPMQPILTNLSHPVKYYLLHILLNINSKPKLSILKGHQTFTTTAPFCHRHRLDKLHDLFMVEVDFVDGLS